MKLTMKKVIAILLVVCMLCPLIAACDDTSGGNSTNGGASTTAPTGEPSGDGGNSNTDPSAKEVTVTFSANGGTFSDGKQSYTQKVKNGKTMAAPESPSRQSYTFKGWSTDKNGGTLWDFAVDTATSDITLYATWAQKSATIFSVEGATIENTDIFLLVDNSTSSVSMSNKVICSEDSVWKLYYDKLGQTEIPTKIAAGMTGSLQNGDNIFYMVVTSNDGTQVNVYELTIHRSYQVPINYYDGDNLLKTENTYTGYEYSVTYKPSITGYTFVEWRTAGGSATNSLTPWTSQNLYAQKTANDYKVTYNANGGTLSETEKTVTYGESYRFPVPTRTGYSFTGWYTTSGTQLTSSTGKSILPWNIAYNTTARATWSVNTYALTLNKNLSSAGSVSGAGNYDYGQSITVTATTNDGYKFIGWYDSSNSLVSEDASYSFDMGLDTTLTAKWDYADITLHYIVNGEVKKTQTYKLNAHINPNNASIDIGDEHFFGWYSSSSFSTSNTKITSTSSLRISGNKAYVYAGTYDGTAGFEFTYNSGNYTISYTGTATDIVIPGTFNGKTVTIGRIFEDNNKIESVVISNGIKSIDFCEFSGCTSLESVTIGDGIESIGANAFSGCSSLTSITIPNSVTSIGSYAFKGCSSLNAVYINDISAWCNIEFNAYYANPLYYAHNLYLNGSLVTDLVIPNTVTTIKSCAFYNCSNFESVTIPDSVESIGGAAFSGCSSLESITLPFVGGSATGTPASKSTLFGYIFGESSYTGGTKISQRYDDNYYGTRYVYYYIPSALKSVTITGGNILEDAFLNCTSLASVTIGNGVTSIGDSAFLNCTSLASVTIGNSVESIGDYAFNYCYRLVEVYNLSSLTIAEGSYDNGSIGRFALSIYTSTSEQSKVHTTTDGYAFYVDGSTVYLVGYTGSDTELVLPNSYNGNNYEINKYAFADSGLTSVTIPNSVESIGVSAFYNCESLNAVYITDIATWCTISFGNDSANPLCYAHDIYLNGTLVTELVIPDSVESIGSYAFSGFTSLTSITIPNSVTSIGSYAFKGCSSLASVTIGNSVESIGVSAFYHCTSLQSITIPDSVTSIGVSAFYHCTSLQSITIPDSVTSIGSSAFEECYDLRIAIIGNGVESIGSKTFYNCTSLQSITIPDSVTSIGQYFLYGVNYLQTVTFMDTSTWYITEDFTNWKNQTGGKQTNVDDAEINADRFQYLFDPYYYYYWYKK